jgi:hypothetical protein
MSRKLRYLRIAFSAVCGVLCLLLIALWVRSYWVWEGFVRGNATPSKTPVVSVHTSHGTLTFIRRVVPPEEADAFRIGLEYHTMPLDADAGPKFIWLQTDTGFILRTPTWFPVPFLAVVAGLPWVWSRRSGVSASALC